MKRVGTPLFIAALVGIALLVGIVAGGQVDPIRGAVDDVFGNPSQDATAQAIDVIHDDYFHTVDNADLETASVGAITTHIKRRYHARFPPYSPPSEYDRSQQGSRLSGVGI